MVGQRRSMSIGQDLAVGQSGVLVDHRVHLVLIDPSLLHIDMVRLARQGTFVVHSGGLGSADDLAGQRATLAQVGQAVAAQDPADGAGGHAELGPDPVLITTLVPARFNDPGFDLDRGGYRGQWLGRDNRSRRPSQPSWWKRLIHLCEHCREAPWAWATAHHC